MDAPSGSRTTLERWIALLVRYWSSNMTLAFRSGGYWPGFGYSDDEKAEMAALSQNCSFWQFLVWTLFVALIAMPVIVVASLPGILLMTSKAGASLPGSVFFLSEGATLVVFFTIGLPVAMLLSSALVGRMYKVADSDLPDRATTARYFHKMWFQLTRIAIVMTVILVPAWILIPDNSKFMVTLHLVIPFLGPAWLSIVSAYYFSRRLKNNADS
jgi:hypothetical protein